MKYAVETSSVAVMHILSFIKIGSAIQNLLRGYTDTQTNRQHGDRISLRSLFQNKESRLKQADG
jgi:hypothetical protein